MKLINEWLDKYDESHENPIDKNIHWICVLLITYTLLGLLWVWVWVSSPYVVLVSFLNRFRVSSLPFCNNGSSCDGICGSHGLEFYRCHHGILRANSRHYGGLLDA